jgi:mRNA interferase RelE/StbE
MKAYRIELDRQVKKDLKALPHSVAKRIKEVIAQLATDPYPPGHKSLKGKHRGYLRVRTGNYRVIYSIEEEVLVVLVVRVGHRKDIYRNF